MESLRKALATWRRLSPWIAGIAVLAVLGGTAAFMSGAFETRASAGHGPLETAVLHAQLRSSVAAGADEATAPADLDSEDRKILGAATYAQYCASCHGAPGLGQNPVALAMTPRPRYLVETASQWRDEELFHLLQHGVKFAGMPAWPVDDRPDEVWSVVAFVRDLPEMPHAEYRRLALEAAVEPPPAEAPHIIGDSHPQTRQTTAVRGRDSADNHAYATPATAFGLVEGTVVRQCASCHGYDGVGELSGLVPNLSIHNAAYLAASLRAYANGTRRSGIMRPIAASLTSGQIDQLADWYARQPAEAAPEPDAMSPDLLDLGERLANSGDGDVAACESCHGVAEALEGEYPALRGQAAAYQVSQLQLFAKSGRGDVVDVNPMYAISHELTDRQMQAVAAWYAVQTPGNYDLEEEYGTSGAR